MVIDKKDLFLQKQMKRLGRQLQTALVNLQSYTQDEITQQMDNNQQVFIDERFLINSKDDE